MKHLIQALAGAERPDLASALATGQLPFPSLFTERVYGRRSLLEHTQATLEGLAAETLGEAALDETTAQPWWSPLPAVYLAAALAHIGLPARCRAGAIAPHSLESAWTAREALRDAPCTFTVREHAVTLIARQRHPLSLIRSGAHGETYLALACSLDLRALCLLAVHDARALGDPEREDRILAFRRHVEQLGVFGAVPPPPLGPDVAERAGFRGADQLHRAMNALRYFRLIARMHEEDWYLERLRQERGRPACRLHLLVGPAGTGKSTWAERHLAHTTIVSSDRMRAELTGDPEDQSQNYLVFQRCMDRVRDELRRGREVTFDATNCSERLRGMPVQAGRWSAAEIVSYLFDIGLDEALTRNAGRERSVPEAVVRRQFRVLSPPALYEADRHVRVDDRGAVEQYWPLATPGAVPCADEPA
jgi:predicted kinase